MDSEPDPFRAGRRASPTRRGPTRSRLTRTLLAVTLLATAVSAQGRRGDDRPGPARDDSITRKDPAIAAIDKFLKRHRPSQKRADWRQAMKAPDEVKFRKDREYRWHLATSKGEVTVRLLPEAAPMHVTSTVYLTRAGFYDGLVFHRIVKGFMAQGGCPLGNGTGNPGYMLDGECKDDVKHDKPGILSTANTGEPKTDGSQFFLTFAPAPHLDGKHTVFGEAIEGLPVLEALDACGAADSAGKPSERIEIVRAWITVVEKPMVEASGGDGDGGE
ncbi:MAG: peptidylprolyl isomerase [Planctomycetota bacterium]